MSEGNGSAGKNNLPKSGDSTSELAIKLLTKIGNKSLDANDLTREQRLVCVRHLSHDGMMTKYEMAHLLKVSERTIYEDRKDLKKGNELFGLMVDEADVAQQLMHEADVACAKLRKSSKWKDAFDVRVKCVEMLQSMGFIKKVETKVNVKGKLTLLEVLEIDADDTFAESGLGFEDAEDGNGRMEAPEV